MSVTELFFIAFRLETITRTIVVVYGVPLDQNRNILSLNIRFYKNKSEFWKPMYCNNVYNLFQMAYWNIKKITGLGF